VCGGRGSTRYPLHRRLDGPQNRSGQFGEQKNCIFFGPWSRANCQETCSVRFAAPRPFRRLCLWQQKVAGSGHSSYQRTGTLHLHRCDTKHLRCVLSKHLVSGGCWRQALCLLYSAKCNVTVRTGVICSAIGRRSLKDLSVDGNIILTDVLMRDRVLD